MSKEITLEELNEVLLKIKENLKKLEENDNVSQKIISRYEDIIENLTNQNADAEKTIFSLKKSNERLLKDIDGLQYSLNLYAESSSWKLTYPLRKGIRLLRILKRVFLKLINEPNLIKKGIVATKKHGISYSYNKFKSLLNEHQSSQRVEFSFNLFEQENIYILTTKHCLYIANLIKNNLEKINIYSQIVFEKPMHGFGKGLHFVICPQMFKELPESYVAYQLEQSVSSRWFTNDYINRLENSYAIFDYSLDNISFLQQKGLYYQQMYFMPIGYNSNYEKDYADVEEEYDVLFYGDVNNDRRKKYLIALKEKFKVKIVSEIFGEELYKEIRKAKIIVNIHYYEGALLETTRLFECLSLKKLIISETSSDMNQHPSLEKSVDFVPVNDINAMCERVAYWLENSKRRKQKILDNSQYLNISPNWFEYYFMRFMLANDWVSFDKFYEIAGKNIHFTSDFICLGLPESTERAKDFQKDNHYNIEYFPGLRHRKGWIGCGLSYKFIFKKAKELALNELIICEDDVEFKTDFSKNLIEIRNYLSSIENWDLFSGVIADLHSNLKILKIDSVNRKEYIYIDRMTSMVLNIYSSRFFDKMIQWDENNHDVSVNAIDRYIENTSHLTTITTIPYLVGHKEELNSTLWGFQNNVYSEMIRNSEKSLIEKVRVFKKENSE